MMKNILLKTHRIIKEVLPYITLTVFAICIYNTKQISKTQTDIREVSEKFLYTNDEQNNSEVIEAIENNASDIQNSINNAKNDIQNTIDDATYNINSTVRNWSN